MEDDVSNQAEQECFIYDSLKEALAKAGLGPLPTAHVVKSDADYGYSISLEWFLPDARLGFNIEIDSSESGWYVLHKDANDMISIRDWGYLATFDADKVVGMMWGEIPQQVPA